MPFYPDSETLYAVMTDLTKRVNESPSVSKVLRDSNAVVRIGLTNPQAFLTIDGRSNPPRLITGSSTDGPKVDVSLRLPADVLHNVWLGKANLRESYFAGKIKLDGSPLRALGLWSSLSGLFRYVGTIYPEILRERGLLA